MSISVFNLFPNSRVDSQINIVINGICTEKDPAFSGREFFLSDNPEKIRKCVAGYTVFNPIYRLCECVKALFGRSDWQLARSALCKSLIERNFNLFANGQAMATSETILNNLTLANATNLFVASIPPTSSARRDGTASSMLYSPERILKILNDHLINIGPDCFELGQYEFKVERRPIGPLAGDTLVQSNRS